MSEFNCVLVSDAAFDEFNANDNARFADIYKAVPDGCVFIVSLPSVKPVKNKTVLPALKKYADKNGIVCEFNTLTQNELVKFIAKWANANGKFISQVNATLRRLVFKGLRSHLSMTAFYNIFFNLIRINRRLKRIIS